MNTLLQQLIMKMGLMKDPNVMQKTTEVLRLLELKSTNVPLQINEYAKMIICIDIAATLLCIPHDKQYALKLSGLRKSQYATNKRMFEKLLDFNKVLTINDVCIQLNMNEMSKKAEELLQIYRQQMLATAAATATEDIMVHPQYVTMAIYMACKFNKKKISKAKCLTYSQLRPTQWQLLEQNWEKILNKHYQKHINEDKDEKKDENSAILSSKEPHKEDIDIESALSVYEEMEPYERWKQRILAKAWYNLQAEN